jgi:imidazolonepropionase-like amidohydrolase
MNRFVGLLLLALPFPAAAQAPKEPSRTPLAITNVAVIDTTGGPSLPDGTVLITGDRISAVGKSDTLAVPRDAMVIDGTGKFLIPGLWDMHVHWLDKPSLPLFTANGVTGIRVMWGAAPHLEWRKEVADGSLLGPRLVVAGNVLDGPRPLHKGSTAVKTPQDGRRAVRETRNAGYDFVKVYNTLSKDAYFAIVDESKTLGLPFAGHVPIHTVSAAEASDAGQKSMEHLYGILLCCSSQEDKLRKQLEVTIGDGTQAPDRALWRRTIEQTLETYDESKAAALFARFKSNGTWQVPTFTVSRSEAYRDDPTFTNDPRVKYLPPAVKERWDKTLGEPRDKAALALRKKRLEHEFKLVLAMHRAGVPILAGTDVDNLCCFPGFSLHDELALLVEAGLSPMDALQTATRNPAKYLGRERDLGTVETGKLADLVLLDADPLKDVTNTRKIAAVVVGGKLLPKESLQKVLADAEAAARRK